MIGQKEKGTSCSRCSARLPGGARRCMKCGAKVFVVEEVNPAEAARNTRERLIRKYKLSPMQEEILAAALGGSREITVLGNDSQAEGEVKSGGTRFYGDEAVAAVAALAGQGLIDVHGEDCFRLTNDGTHVVKTIQSESKPEPA